MEWGLIRREQQEQVSEAKGTAMHNRTDGPCVAGREVRREQGSGAPGSRWQKKATLGEGPRGTCPFSLVRLALTGTFVPHFLL